MNLGSAARSMRLGNYLCFEKKREEKAKISIEDKTANQFAPYFETFSHDADIGVRGKGSTMTDAFIQAAKAMMSVITDLDRIEPLQNIDIYCEAPNADLLLVDWLNALVYEMSTHELLFCDFQLKITENQLNGKAWGEPLDIQHHKPAAEIKGATLTELSVMCDSRGIWTAQCVVDV